MYGQHVENKILAESILQYTAGMLGTDRINAVLVTMDTRDMSVELNVSLSKTTRDEFRRATQILFDVATTFQNEAAIEFYFVDEIETVEAESSEIVGSLVSR